jgi:acetylornithine deacetylase/succinyl-diaminopimelate desuccinylase-like protein
MNAHEYAAAKADSFRAQLYDLIRIPSVSTLPERKGEVLRAAEWLADDLRRIGLEKVVIMPTGGHPVVYGEWLGAGAAAPTVLIYGHYDVQPAEMVDGWTSDPFEPVERNGRIVARGSSDDKGQMFAQVKAVESLLAAGAARVNFKLLIEGEEEIGSANLSAFVKQHRELLMADVCVVSDTGMKVANQPVISYATRGLLYMELEVIGPKQDLHSGGYGGLVHNPAQALAEILAQLHTPDGRIDVPGFYDAVREVPADERQMLAETAQPLPYWQEVTGIPAAWGEPDYAPHERVTTRPTLEVNGMVSGFYGPGTKTVLPAKALAKLSCRLVPDQDPYVIFEQIKARVAAISPGTVTVELRALDFAYPAVMDIHAPAMQAASAAYECGWGTKPIFERIGGTLPVLADFQQQLNGLPIVLMGFGLNSDGAHGPDESFSIEMFHKGIDTAIYFYELLEK